MLKILIVDDEAKVRLLLAGILKELGPEYHVCGEAESAEEALEIQQEKCRGPLPAITI